MASIAPSMARKEKGVGTTNRSVDGMAVGTEDGPAANGNGAHVSLLSVPAESGNPTVLPRAALEKFHFTFLIRHPRSSVPSYYRCTVPPLRELTGFDEFMPEEMGYGELRRFFDYLRNEELIGPSIAGRHDSEHHADEFNGTTDKLMNGDGSNEIMTVRDIDGVLKNGEDKNGDMNGAPKGIEICLIDADDLLDRPAAIIEAYCRSVGIPYDPGMLSWDTEADQDQAHTAFAKWKGFHEDALNSRALTARSSVC